MTPAPATQTDLKSTLEEMRASVAARGARKGFAVRAGLTGAIEEAFLRLLTVLLAILEDFRAGRLARMAPVGEVAGDDADGAVADRCPGVQRGSIGASEARNRSDVRACGLDRRVNPWIKSGGGGEVYELGVEDGAGRAASRHADFEGVHEVIGEADDGRPEADPPPSRCAGPSLPHKGGGTLRASLRRPRLAMTARWRRRAGWRNARGIRRAVPPRGEMAGADEGLFFEKCDRRRTRRHGDFVPA
jgi:hypothetical protein